MVPFPRWWVRSILIMLLTACAASAQPRPAPDGDAVSVHAAAAATSTPDDRAPAWIVTAPAADVGAGYVRGVRAAIDVHGHVHRVHVQALEWLGAASEAGVIVAGTTPSGDHYELRLATMTEGHATTGIGAWGDHVIVTAGIIEHGTSVLRCWESRDGGVTWTEFVSPVQGAWQADVAFLPDGRAVLVAGTGADATTATVIATEQPDGTWQTTQPLAADAAGTQHTVWSVAQTDTSDLTLPNLIVIISTRNGFTVLRSTDGLVWNTHTVTTAQAHTPRLIAADSTLVLTHTVYGRAGLWLATSRDGGMTWGTVQLPGVVVQPAPIWDAAHQTLGIVAAQVAPETGWQTIIVMTAPITDVLSPSAWTPDPARPDDAWQPIPLIGGQTEQARPFMVQRGDAGVIVWEGWDRPIDLRNATDADFRPRSVVMQATLRPAWLTDAARMQNGRP